MTRPVKLSLWALSLVLLLFPLSAARPGQPPVMKADEPAYFLAGLSLIHDGDLRCDQHDIQRAFDHYQYFPVDNLILASPDGWQTVYFGKPYIYSLLAAPLAAIAGPRGYVVFNMLLLVGMIWMGTIYLKRFNPDALAAIFSSLFFLLSAGFAYVFWIHPEMLNMFSVAACLFFAFHDPAPQPRPPTGGFPAILGAVSSASMYPFWSGAALAFAVYNKPMLALLGVPALTRVLRRRGWKAATAWLAAAVLTMTLIAGVSVALTGKPSAYLGFARGGVNAERPGDYSQSIATARKASQARSDANPNSWQWMFRIPEVDAGKFLDDIRYFLIGRHTGILPYLPFAVLAVVLFLTNGRRSRLRWLLLASCAGVALIFLLWIPFNWHGGGGFVGNRYYVNAYPAFLFLVTAIRPAAAILCTAGFAALTVGSLVFAPWGLAVPKGSLQAHTRGGLYRYFPVELGFHNRISGYEAFGVADVGMVVREDLTKILSKEEGIFRVRGAVSSELWVFGNEPLERVFFEVRSPLADNRISIKHAGQKRVVSFEDAEERGQRQTIVEIPLHRSTRVHKLRGGDQFFYKLLVRPEHGLHEGGNMRDVSRNPIFYAGARFRLLGTQDPGASDDAYRISWQRCAIPASAEARGRMQVPIAVTNAGRERWRAGSATQVRFTYQWLDAQGGPVESPDFRYTRLRGDVRPGSHYRTTMVLYAPSDPGTYDLVIDATRMTIGRFPPREGATCSGTVTVERPEAGT